MTDTRFLKVILIPLLISALLLPNFSGLAMPAEEERELLEQELRELEEQIAALDKDIQATEQEKRTLQNQIYILQNQIKKLDLQIYQNNLMVEDLSLQVEDTEASIEDTSLKIKESRSHLANNLQLIYEADQTSLIEVLFTEEELSDFFDNLMALESLNSKSQELLKNIENLKVQLETQKEALDEEKQDLENLVVIQNLQRKESASTKKEKDRLLDLTETEYQKQLQEKTDVEKRAAEIRGRIFDLIGIPEAPTFGEAYDLAKEVERMTGVRAAFLLAVLKQESDIGQNVGQCYLKNPSTGEGVVALSGKKISRVMKPMGLSGRKGDIDDFLTITAELVRDPYNTPVSCPMSYGWGGAMGPAQFIPSTWMIYKDRVSQITGKPADPWNIKDAFLAAALYLADYGATQQNYSGEWRAAMIYFSGTTNTKYRFYGDSVMKITSQYEIDISEIEQAA